MLHVKSLMCETVAVVGGFYYLARTIHLGEKDRFQLIKPKLVHAEADLPSSNLKLKESGHINGNADPAWDTDWDHMNGVNRNDRRKRRKTLLFICAGDIKEFDIPEGLEEAYDAGLRIREIFGEDCNEGVSYTANNREMHYITEYISQGMDIGESSPAWEDNPFLLSGRPYRCDPPRPGLPSVTRHDIFEQHAFLEAEYRKIFHRPTTVSCKEVYVCKRNTIKYFVNRALQLPLIAWDRFNMLTGSFTLLEIKSSGRVECKSISSVGHILEERKKE